jgi:hypothetical protein
MLSPHLIPLLPLLLGFPAQIPPPGAQTAPRPIPTPVTSPASPVTHPLASSNQEGVQQSGEGSLSLPVVLDSSASASIQAVQAASVIEREAPALTQEDGEKKQSLLERARARRQARNPKAPELRRADGSLVEPGVIPSTASESARNTWEALKEALASDEPMESFYLYFNLRQHSPETTQSNDMALEFAYLAPKFVHARLESGRTLVRGKEGDHLVDGEEVIELKGREAAADRKTLDEMAAIASTFMALTAPASLRLVDLEMLEKAPAGIHPSYHKEMKNFLWMRVESPDFFLYRAQRPDGIPVYQADLGIDPETKAIRFAVIREANGDPKLAPSPLFVRMSDHVRREGFFVPHRIEICNLDPTSNPPRFYRRATSRLDLKRKKGKLRAGLTANEFVPRR